MYNSSDEEGSDGESFVEASKYKRVDMGLGLGTWSTRIWAMNELRICFEKVYKAHATKATQQELLKDLSLAVQSCDGRSSCKDALKSLVKAAEKVLPQQKRNQVAGEVKKKLLALSRQGRRAGGDLEEEHQDVAADTTVQELPLEVVRLILERLDSPVDATSAACTCRCWCSIARNMRSWRQWYALLQRNIPAAGDTWTAAEWHRQFALFVQGRPALVLQWRSKRVLHRNNLYWVSQLPQLSQVQRQGRATFVTEDMVVTWLLGGGTSRICGTSTSDDSGSSSEGERDPAGAATRQLRLWAL
mmetsp:Transcript_8955/g.19148  ORF Transcript_8955/g.19148 Transcript_8955/m.19148 type:complete len:302 (+) Transcript_8955:146-1051(+)|eukprot:CAMPEP_0202896312 /NCGR_PEP_ID=MMETSP1392-20130828/5344_1 /ASSEMBLY_ACC=CAM_ASM_000868 /TAXON_ID=225041 /ORGANISM="Chlamydomonas chlamydogama, Strain SAG 11-48b" /LENGTH=301 /DNA_ID=CAMNT_0049581625 /DNA_START=101 /DNA_END=1006 /DNA_ORIENTATION=+